MESLVSGWKRVAVANALLYSTPKVFNRTTMGGGRRPIDEIPPDAECAEAILCVFGSVGTSSILLEINIA